MDLDHWLERIGLGPYAPLFKSNDIDSELLGRLTDADLKDIGVASLGHRKKLLEAISALPTAAVAVAGEPRPTLGVEAGPERYIPRYLVEKILLSKAALEGERKHVTVLFADLRGSMELLADRDPEEARRILDPVLEAMMDAVHGYEGTVNQVMGDGIMALFGAPLAHEDHAVRACYAALRMQRSLQHRADTVRRTHGVEVQIRVGLNSGEVVVRSIGSDLRMDYTAVGQTTHLAARMEQLAPPGSIRLTAATVRLAEGYVDIRALGPVPVKGIADPVEVFELRGAGSARSRFQAVAARGLTRFVGRDGEIEQLRRILESGRGQVVAIVGEAGVGKSRLVHEFTRSHRVQGWLVLDAASESYGKATSYLPVIGLLKGYFRIDERDDHREMHAKIIGRVLGLDRSLEPLLPPFLALLDVPVEDAAWMALDPRRRRQRTLDAIRHLLVRESQVQPLLVIFEDLHWIDGETQALLDGLVEGIGSARMVLVVNYRPQYQHRWGGKPVLSQIRLDSLPAESTTQLLAALLGTDPELGSLTQMLVKRGNPFFLEETVRTLVETGTLGGLRGAYRLMRPLTALQVPATVQAMLAARIDRLPPAEKQLLQAASAIGKAVPYALLTAIAEVADEDLRRMLDHLQEAEFLYETRLFPDLEHTFKHALTHEVTYGGLLQDRRRELHARIAAAIERLSGDRLSEHVEQLAHHALRGHLWDAAVRYGRQAATRALDRSAAREALHALDGARSGLQQLAPTRERDEQLVDLCFDQRHALVSLGEFAQLGDVVDEARAVAEQLGDRHRLGRALGYLALQHGILGAHASAIEAGERAAALAEAEDDAESRIVAHYYLGLALFYGGDPRRAAAASCPDVDLVKGGSLGGRLGLVAPPAVLVGFVLGLVLADVGEFDRGILAGHEGLRIAQASGHPYSEVLARWSLGYAHLRRGDFGAAIGVLEPALALCHRMEIRFALPYISAFLGAAHLNGGSGPESVVLLEEALEQNASMRILGHRPLFANLLGEAYLGVGRIADAERLAQEALALARQYPSRGWEAWTLRLLGEIRALEPASRIEAGTALERALELAGALEMRPLVAHCRLGLAKLRAAMGAREEACAHASAAATLYAEMRMPSGVGRAEALLAEERRSAH